MGGGGTEGSGGVEGIGEGSVDAEGSIGVEGIGEGRDGAEGSGGVEGIDVCKDGVDGAGTSAILPVAGSRLQLVSGATIRKAKTSIIDNLFSIATSITVSHKLCSFQLKRFFYQYANPGKSGQHYSLLMITLR